MIPAGLRTIAQLWLSILLTERIEKLTNWKIPLFDINFGPEEQEVVAEVLQSGWLTMGPKTQTFEQRFAQVHGSPHGIAVSSCTAALQLAFAALGIGAGDEVIMPSMTFVASANAAAVCGATPIFADIVCEAEPTIDPDHIASLITPRTRAILVVHYAGYACRMDEIMQIADRHHLPVVEDCAHAPQVQHNGRYLGAIGAIGCFSFFSNKNMTTAEGGMALTHDEQLASSMRLLRSHGMTTGTWERHNERPQDYDVVDFGWNFRIDELRAALGLVQLEKVAQANARRAELTSRYRSLLSEVPDVQVAFQHNLAASACHILPLLTRDLENRKVIEHKLNQARVQTSHHYPPVHLFKKYRDEFNYQEGMLPYSESFSAKEITLPLYPDMSNAHIDYIVNSLHA